MSDFIVVAEHIPNSNGGWSRELALRQSSIVGVTAPSLEAGGKGYYMVIHCLGMENTTVRGAEVEMQRLYNLITKGQPQ